MVEVTGGSAEAQPAGFGWGADAPHWSMDGFVGDALVVEFAVEVAGIRHVIANLATAVDDAHVEISVNNDPPQPAERFNRTVAHDPIDLGAHDLKGGPNRLTIRNVGEHAAAVSWADVWFGLSRT